MKYAINWPKPAPTPASKPTKSGFSWVLNRGTTMKEGKIGIVKVLEERKPEIRAPV